MAGSIDTIAAECGIGSPVTLRQNFSAAFRTSPSQYRARFRAEAAKLMRIDETE